MLRQSLQAEGSRTTMAQQGGGGGGTVENNRGWQKHKSQENRLKKNLGKAHRKIYLKILSTSRSLYYCICISVSVTHCYAPLAERDCLGYGKRTRKDKCHVYLQTNYVPERLFITEFIIEANNYLIIVNTSMEKGKELINRLLL